MARIKRLVIPLRTDEQKTLQAWARRERLPMATAARRMLLKQAERSVPPNTNRRQA